MVDKQKIIQLWHVEKKSESAISSELGISRNTVRRYLKAFRGALMRSNETGSPAPSLSEYLLAVPKYNVKNRGKRKLTSEIMGVIDGYLRENEEKRRTGKRKQVYKGIDIWEQLQEAGYDIGYTVVCNYIRSKKLGKQEVFIRQEYNPGENCEFDWCDIHLNIGGVERKLLMAVFTMCKSNSRFGIICQRQDTLSFMESHIAFFDHIDGVPIRMNYDNMRVAIAEFVGPNEKKPTVALMQLSSFYGFSFRFCNIMCGHEKGHVERSVEYLRRKAFARHDKFDTIAMAQLHLDETCGILNGKKLTGCSNTIDELMLQERDSLLPYPGRMECYTLEEARVGKYSTFVYCNNHYSVPDHLVGQKVEIKAYANQIKVYQQGYMLCKHHRDYGSGNWIITLEHYLRALKRKPGALHGSAALKQAPVEVVQVYESAFRENARDFIELLQYCKMHDISYKRMLEVYMILHEKCPSDISLDKFKALLGNNPDKVGLVYPETDIHRHSMNQLSEISQILNQN